MSRIEAARGFSPPPEVLNYFEQKRLRPAFSWQDVWGEEHAYGFTVAKAVDTELLSTFKGSIETALREGQGFETWRAGIESDLRRLGWWGPRTVADPAGIDPAATVDFSRPRRLRTIYWSNMRSARAAGQWERMERTKAALPYILYVRTAAADPRPEHLSWVGIILPVDDPFWRTHFPPNGWGCLCSVRQISAREAERLLGRVPEEGGIVYRNTAPQEVTRTFRNRRTGTVTEVPEGIDAGWHTNSGLSRARTLTRRLEETLIEAGEAEARKAIGALFDARVPDVMAGLSQRARMPVAVSAEAQASLGARHSLVVAGNDTIAAKTHKHREVTPARFASVQDILDRGFAMPDPHPKRRRYLAEIDGMWFRVVLTVSATGYLRVQTFHRMRRDQVERLINRNRGE